MKKFLLRFSLLLSGICVGQPYPPTSIHDVYVQPKESKFTLVINVGTLMSLGGEVAVKLNNNIIGVGYGGNVNQYKRTEFKNQTLYLSYGYKVNKFIYGGRIGKQNKANWIPTQNNPNTQQKEVTPYSLMVGGFIGYQANNKLRFMVGVDNFSQATIGIGLGL